MSVCVNNNDTRLQIDGISVCTPSDVLVWELRKPRADSAKAEEASNAVALRDAMAAFGTNSVSGSLQGTVTFAPAINSIDECTAPVPVVVPLTGPATDRKGKATIKTKAATVPPPGESQGSRDSDTLKLTCLPSQ